VRANAVRDQDGKKVVFLAFDGKARLREVHVLSMFSVVRQDLEVFFICDDGPGVGYCL
jgi:hypothetical protein